MPENNLSILEHLRQAENEIAFAKRAFIAGKRGAGDIALRAAVIHLQDAEGLTT